MAITSHKRSVVFVRLGTWGRADLEAAIFGLSISRPPRLSCDKISGALLRDSTHNRHVDRISPTMAVSNENGGYSLDFSWAGLLTPAQHFMFRGDFEKFSRRFNLL